MALYNCGYPIYHTISNQSQGFQDYSISIGGTIVYTGRIYFKSTVSQTETIDVSPIAREYIDVLYENINFIVGGVYNLPTNSEGVGSIITLTVIDSMGSTDYPVIYNYNTDYVQQSNDSGVLREPITITADPRQLLFGCGYSNVGTVVYQQTNTAGGNSGGAGQQGRISGLAVNLATYTLDQGDKVTITVAGQPLVYDIVKECRNRFALYYVNKYGALEAILCENRSDESWTRSDISVERYKDRLDRFTFEQVCLRSDIQRTFTFRTGWVPKLYERNIDNLINCVKCWIHDLDKGIIFAAQIDMTSFEAQQNRYSKLFRYEFQVKESQKQLRR